MSSVCIAAGDCEQRQVCDALRYPGPWYSFPGFGGQPSGAGEDGTCTVGLLRRAKRQNVNMRNAMVSREIDGRID